MLLVAGTELASFLVQTSQQNCLAKKRERETGWNQREYSERIWNEGVK